MQRKMAKVQQRISNVYASFAVDLDRWRPVVPEPLAVPWERFLSVSWPKLQAAPTTLYGHLIQLPEEVVAKKAVWKAVKTEKQARAYVGGRLTLYFHAVMIGVGTALSHVPDLIAWWRLDAMDSPTADDYVSGVHGYQKGNREHRERLKEDVQREIRKLTRGDVYSLADYKALQRGSTADEDGDTTMSSDTDAAHARAMQVLLDSSFNAQLHYDLCWLTAPHRGVVPYGDGGDAAATKAVRDFASRVRSHVATEGERHVDQDVMKMWRLSGLAAAADGGGPPAKL